jgi:uncharacterized small protein (DUF1192 family)
MDRIKEMEKRIADLRAQLEILEAELERAKEMGRHCQSDAGRCL